MEDELKTLQDKIQDLEGKLSITGTTNTFQLNYEMFDSKFNYKPEESPLEMIRKDQKKNERKE